MFGWVASIGKYAGTINQIAQAGAAVGQVYASYKQLGYIEDQQKAQVAEARRQETLAKSRTAREARVRTAQLLAQQGRSGAIASTVSGGVIGVQSDLKGAFGDIEGATAHNISQFDIAASNSRNEAFGSLVSGVFSAGAHGALAASTLSEAPPKSFSDAGPYNTGYQFPS